MFRVISITEEISSYVRDSLRSPQYCHPAYVEPATGCFVARIERNLNVA